MLHFQNTSKLPHTGLQRLNPKPETESCCSWTVSSWSKLPQVKQEQVPGKDEAESSQECLSDNWLAWVIITALGFLLEKKKKLMNWNLIATWDQSGFPSHRLTMDIFSSIYLCRCHLMIDTERKEWNISMRCLSPAKTRRIQPTPAPSGTQQPQHKIMGQYNGTCKNSL